MSVIDKDSIRTVSYTHLIYIIYSLLDESRYFYLIMIGCLFWYHKNFIAGEIKTLYNLSDFVALE